MKSLWRDGERTREVELTAVSPGRWRVRVDDAEFEVVAEVMPDGKLRLVSDGRTTVAEVTPAGARRFVRLGTLDFVLEREFLEGFAELTQAPAPELALAAAAIADALDGGASRPLAAPGTTAAARPDPFAVLGRWRHAGLDS